MNRSLSDRLWFGSIIVMSSAFDILLLLWKDALVLFAYRMVVKTYGLDERVAVLLLLRNFKRFMIDDELLRLALDCVLAFCPLRRTETVESASVCRELPVASWSDPSAIRIIRTASHGCLRETGFGRHASVSVAGYSRIVSILINSSQRFTHFLC